MNSLEGTCSPTESDIFKMVDLFQLHHNVAIIDNCAVHAFSTGCQKTMDDFCGEYSLLTQTPL